MPDDKIVIPGQLALVDPYRLFGGKGITPYNPSALVGIKGLRVFDRMRADEQIKSALAFKKHAILAAGWDVVSPDGLEDEWPPREFVMWSLERLAGSFNDRIWMMLTAIEYGFSVSEILWEPAEGGPFAGLWTLQDIVAIKPHSVQFQQNEQGKLLEILQWGVGREIHIPPEKVVLMTYQNEWSNPYGRSDLEAVYRSWWAKDAAHKWLAMLLERFGIPPIFLMYDYNKYSGQTLETLKLIINNLQAGTAAIIPRLDKDSIEPWTPTLAAQVAEVFIPALDRYDTEIARGILMPNLLGTTPEKDTGSYARAAVVFDVFMFAVDSLRTQVEETINDQIIWRLMAANYPVERDLYPRFKFRPLTQDSRVALMDTWSKLVTGRSVLAREEDETHIREIMGFPAPESEPIPPPDPVVPPGGGKGEKFTMYGGIPGGGMGACFAERAIDFKAIEKRLDKTEESFIDSAKASMMDMQASLQRRIKTGVDPASIKSVGVAYTFLRIAIEKMMRQAFEDGRMDLATEADVRRFLLESGYARRFFEALPRVKPRDAVDFIKRKAITLSATVEDEILRDVRRILISALETGLSTAQMTEALGVVFEKWIGSDLLRDGEAVKPVRLEAIARTESTAAYNHGRVVAARDPELKGLLRGMRFDAILDSRTSEVCQHLNGKIIRMADESLDSMTPPMHVNCVVGETIVSGPRARVKSRRWYDGDIIIIRTAGGKKLTCTPNHPILTDFGWKPAASIDIGSSVVGGCGHWTCALGEVDNQSIPTRIENVSVSRFGGVGVVSREMPTADEDFHGDGTGSKIAVIGADRLLWDRAYSSLLQQRIEIPLGWRVMRLQNLSHSIMCSFRESLPFLFGGLAHAHEHAGAFTSQWYTVFSQPSSDGDATRQVNPGLAQASQNGILRDAQLARDLIGGEAGPIQIDEVVCVERNAFHGHVYNLETAGGWYEASGIITGNCRSILTPITISRQVDEAEFISPSDVGRAKELAGSGFAGGGSFRTALKPSIRLYPEDRDVW